MKKTALRNKSKFGELETIEKNLLAWVVIISLEKFQIMWEKETIYFITVVHLPGLINYT